MKQKEQTELLRAQQVLNEVNRKLLVTLGVAEVFPWKWELAECMIWFDTRPSDDPEGWKITHNDLSPVSIARVHEDIYKENRFHVVRACRELLNGRVRKAVIELHFWAREKEGLMLEWLKMHIILGKYDENGKLLMVEGSLMSVSKWKTLEEELTTARERAGEANRLESVLIANMNHEIHILLNTIVDFTSLLSIVDDKKEQQEYIDLIQSSTEYFLRLMNDVIDFSNIESGVMDMAGSDVPLDPLMEETEQIYRPKVESRNLVLVWDGEQPGARIYTDRSRLIRILEYLPCNAIKFILKGTVRLGYRKREGGRIWFYVTDTGCGIPGEKKEFIFECFAKPDNFVQGLGLELPLCKIIIGRLYGTIGVDSKVREGSTFWFTPPNLSGKLI